MKENEMLSAVMSFIIIILLILAGAWLSTLEKGGY